jgi:hypothetical protein
MKKLSKLSINPSKVMKNEELVNLKGGYNGGYGGLCESCEDCFGSILVCESQLEQAFQDYDQNCGPNSHVTFNYIPGC